MYKVIREFYDLNDNYHAYLVGDVFPRKGKRVNAERLAYLSSAETRLGVPVIQEVANEQKQRKKN